MKNIQAKKQQIATGEPEKCGKSIFHLYWISDLIRIQKFRIGFWYKHFGLKIFRIRISSINQLSDCNHPILSEALQAHL